jgi:hypothetical protein
VTTTGFGQGYSFDDVRVRRLLQKDISINRLIIPITQSCGDSVQTVQAQIRNLGVQPQSNIPLSAEISGSIIANLGTIFPGPLNPGDSAIVNFGTFNSLSGGNIQLRLINSLVGDEDRLNDTLTNQLVVNPIPNAPIIANQTICGGETATFNILGTATEFRWYPTATATTPIAISGNSFTTPALNDTTNYFVSGVNISRSTVGPPSTAIGAGGQFNFFSAGVQFDVLRTLTLDSVFIYPGSTGLARIVIRNGAGTTVATRDLNVTVPNVRTRFPVNVSLPAGQNYTMTAEGSTVSGLFRSTSNVSYPYTLTNSISLKNATPSSSFIYYFFYDWHLTLEQCESPTLTQARSSIWGPISIPVSLPMIP